MSLVFRQLPEPLVRDADYTDKWLFARKSWERRITAAHSNKRRTIVWTSGSAVLVVNATLDQ